MNVNNLHFPQLGEIAFVLQSAAKEYVGALSERPQNKDAEEVSGDRWGRTGSDVSA